MNKFGSFILGVLFSVFVLGGAAAWFFMRTPDQPAGTTASPSTAPPVVPVVKENDGKVALKIGAKELTPQQKVELARDNSFSLSGSINLPPQLKASLQEGKPSTLRVTALMIKGDSQVVLATSDYENPKFPMRYSLRIGGDFVPDLIGKDKVGPIQVFARHCFSPAPRQAGCSRVDYPRLNGFTDVTLNVPGGMRGQVDLQIPPIFFTRRNDAPNVANCIKNNSSTTGSVAQTPEFTATKFSGNAAVVWVPAALVGIEGTKGKRVDMSEAARLGLVYDVVKLNGSAPAPFSVKFDMSVPFSSGDYYAVLCKAGEAGAACAARALEIPSGTPNFFPEKSIYKLIPKGWKMPTCGTKDAVLYLHAWSAVTQATEVDFAKAKDVPVVNGMTF